MKAKVIKIDVPVGKDTAIPAYRVDIEDYQVIDYDIEGYQANQVIGYHRKGTYNVYEQEAVANYVANAINNGEIIPYMMGIDYTCPED